MRIITVQHPMAHAITHLGKDVENRTRNIAGAYRGPVAVHAGQRVFDPSGDQAKRIEKITGNRPLLMMPGHYGAIVGVVDLIDVHDGSKICAPRGSRGMNCSKWADHGAMHLVLANPRPLAEPIPYTGALGLRELDAETVARIEAALR